MLSGEGNEIGEKSKIGLISKKATLTLKLKHTFFVHFFAVVLHDHNVKRPEASWLHGLWGNCRTCSCLLFFHCRSFSPRWPLAFLIFSPPLQILCCSSNKKCLLCFFYLALALFPFELRWPVALLSLFLCLSLPLFSKFVDMTINLNLIL